MNYKEEFVDLHGASIQILRGGSGPDLLYLHSAGGEVAWLPFFDQLAEQFSVHLPGHPGFAASEGLDRIDSIHDLVFHTVDLMDGLGLERPAVVGLSLGGWLAAELAVHHPERVSRLVLIDPVGIRVEGSSYADFFAVPVPELRHLVFADGESDVARAFMPDDPSPEMLENALKAMQATARLAWNPLAYDPKLRDRLYRVQAPTLVIWGEQDRLAGLEYAKAWSEGIAGSQLVVLDGVGHAPPFEAPEETARTIAEFLMKS
jgi:pimeloyl-ACP methyl ester carboxylesterase